MLVAELYRNAPELETLYGLLVITNGHLIAEQYFIGLLYLNDGVYEGNQVLPADWVRDSLQRCSERVNISGWISGITIGFSKRSLCYEL